MKRIVFLHGMASSARSAKAQYLASRLGALAQVDFRALDLNPTPADFEFMTVTGMVDRLRQSLQDVEAMETALIGSSLGALVAMNYAHRYGGIAKVMLLAPLLAFSSGGWGHEELERWQREGMIRLAHFGFNREVPLRYAFVVDGSRYDQPVPPAAPTLIIHGRHDDVISVQQSRDYAARHAEVRLIEVDSDHRLADQLPLIWDRARRFLLAGKGMDAGLG